MVKKVRVRAATWLLFVCLVACGSQQKTQQPPAPVRIAYRSIVSSLDPLSEYTLISASIYGNVYEGLVFRTSDFQIQPGLAIRWSTPDDRTWIFELRRDVTFHDGTPFTADDVKFTLDRVVNAPSAQQSSALTVVERVEASDAHTVRIVTRQPVANLPGSLYTILILPRKYFDIRHPESTGTIPGTGPYRVKSWESGKYVQLEANHRYWGTEPAIGEVRFELITNPDEAVQKLLKGDIDILPQLEPSTVDRFGLSNRKEISLRNYPGMMVLYLEFDMAHEKLPDSSLRSNPFRDIRVRKAVYHAVNAEKIIRDIQKGYAMGATQLIAPAIYGFNREIQRLEYDPAEARRLLAAAGYPDGFSVRLDITNNRYRSDVEVGKAIAADLSAVGIRIRLNALPKDEWLKLREKGETPFYMGGWMVGSGDAAGALDYLIHTPENTFGYGRANSGGYSNPEIDRIIEECARSVDPKKRLALLEKAMAMTMDDVAAVPLYIEQNLAASRTDILWEPRSDEIINASSIRR